MIELSRCRCPESHHLDDRVLVRIVHLDKRPHQAAPVINLGATDDRRVLECIKGIHHALGAHDGNPGCRRCRQSVGEVVDERAIDVNAGGGLRDSLIERCGSTLDCVGTLDDLEGPAQRLSSS